MYNLMGRSVALGVSGSIAAYKAADLASKLTQAGAKGEGPPTPARVGPEAGRLASGHTGPGRMSEVDTIMGALRYVLGRGGDLAGKKVVISAGGTQEPIDPVRFVGNYSSGKMGYALAEAARDRGAETVLVSGPVALPAPYAVRVIPVRRAGEMRDAVVEEGAQAGVLIMAAAVPAFP